MTKLIEHSRRHGPFDLRGSAIRERLALRAAARRSAEAVAPVTAEPAPPVGAAR